jgi:hypothetical protein
VLRVAHRVEDRVLGEERVAGEVHLRDEPGGERGPEERQVDVRCTPGVLVVAPRVGAGLDRDEAVATLVVGHAATAAAEVGVERGRMAIHVVPVAARSVGLPQLDQRVSHGAPVTVEHPAVQDDPLAERLVGVLAREVVVELADQLVAEHGTRDLRQRVRQRDQRALGRAGARGQVVGMEVGRVGVLAPVAEQQGARDLDPLRADVLR